MMNRTARRMLISQKVRLCFFPAHTSSSTTVCAHRSKDGRYAFVPNDKNELVRWDVLPKPKGRINLKVDMELNECAKDRQLFLTMRVSNVYMHSSWLT
jgi:hypothetical protein